MKGKKGLDYIDWSISMGIFIIAIIALFVFLKPGARPDHDQDTLTDLVEQKFLERTRWFVHETPLYVKKLPDIYGSGQQAYIDVQANGDIRFSAIKPQSHPKYEPITFNPTKIKLDCHFPECDNTNFTLIGTTKTQQETIDMEAECMPSGQPNVCTAILGATITHQGLQQSELTNLKNANYTTIKNAWTYPLQREFAIYERDANTNSETKIIGGTEPTQQANVFVKELKVNLIDNQGTQKPTIINIRVW